MKYKIILLPRAEKALDKIPMQFRYVIILKLKELSNTPRPNKVKKLKGISNQWRIRVGKYRIVYEIYDDKLIIRVIDIDHRKNIYQ